MGRLIGVHVSSIVNEVIREILNLLIFFFNKKISQTKHKNAQKAQNAQKAEKAEKAQKAQNANKRLSSS